MNSIWIIVALSAVLALSADASVLHTAPPLPKGFIAATQQLVSELSPTVTFTVALKAADSSQIKNLALQVSDPNHANYGKYLTREQLHTMAAPSPKDIAAVTNWLASAGGLQFTLSASTVQVTTTVARAEALLATQFVSIVKENTGKVLLRAGDYSLPTHIDDCSIIYGLHGYPVPEQLQKAANNTTGYKFQDPITPEVIKKQYGVTEMNRTKGVNIPKKATVNFQGQNPSAVDLKTFFQKYVKDAQPDEDRWTKVVGDPVRTISYRDGEAEMDIQYIKGVAPGVEAEVWNYESLDFCQDLKSLTTAILNATDAEVPRVFSLSYGWQGKFPMGGCTDEKVKDVEQDFQKVALRGITLIVGSGDAGAGYNGEFDRAMDGHLYTAWPASSPWVTAVGATEFTKDGTGTEQAVSTFGSGGGFSRYPGSDTRVDAPWQENAVQAYLKHLDALPGGKLPPRQLLGGNTDGPFWTTTGRATPDVAVLGSPEFRIVQNGEDGFSGGTSASAPTFAGLVSLLNAARAQHGAPPMGFMNPFVYQHPEAFTDIVLGDNSHCDWDAPSTFGFKATKGWDPVTGMGVPNFPKLMEAALADAPQVAELA